MGHWLGWKLANLELGRNMKLSKLHLEIQNYPTKEPVVLSAWELLKQPCI